MVGNLRPHCLFASEAEGRRHANEMNLRKRETHEASLQHKGWMARQISPLPPVVAEVFFLTSPFIERGYRPCGVLVRDLSGFEVTVEVAFGTCLRVPTARRELSM